MKAGGGGTLVQGFLLGVELTLRGAVTSPIPSSGDFNANLNSLEVESLPIIMIIINSRTVATEPQASGMQPVITSLLNAHGNG